MAWIRTCTICGLPYPSGGYKAHYVARGHRGRNIPSAEYLRRTYPDTAARDAAIVAALDSSPYVTLEAVGKDHDLTRERVRQIYKDITGKGAFRPRPKPVPVCTVCNTEYVRGQYAAHALAAGHGQHERERVRNIEWVRLYTEDLMTTVQIARLYKVNPSTVVQLLNRYGVQMRPRSVKGGTLVRSKR